MGSNLLKFRQLASGRAGILTHICHLGPSVTPGLIIKREQPRGQPLSLEKNLDVTQESRLTVNSWRKNNLGFALERIQSLESENLL